MYKQLAELIKSLRTDMPAFENVVKYVQNWCCGAIAPRVLTSNSATGERIIFLSQPKNMKKSHASTPLAAITGICGGIVLEYPSMDVLALPPTPLIDQFNRRELLENFSSYTVEHAIDGTQLTAYWNDGWKLSTANGYDVGDLKWFGGKTFMEATAEVVGSEFFTTLDRNCSHTFVIRHPQFHPLEADTMRGFSVVSVDIGYFNNDFSYVTAVAPLPPLPRHELLPNMTPADHYKSLVNINRNSLYGLVRLKTTPRYGFILRSTAPGLPNIIMRSTLEIFLRDNIYNVPEDSTVTAEKRLDFMILRGWLSYNTRFILGDLMPKRTGVLYKKFAQLIVDVTKLIIAGSEEGDKYHMVATAMCEKMHADGVNFDQLDPGAESQIADYLTNPKFAGIYLRVL